MCRSVLALCVALLVVGAGCLGSPGGSDAVATAADGSADTTVESPSAPAATGTGTMTATEMPTATVTATRTSGPTPTPTITHTVTDTTGDGDDGSVTAMRTLSTTNVTVGGRLQVRLSAKFERDKEAVTILDGYTGPVATPTIEAIRVGGENVSARVSRIDPSGLFVAIEDVPAGETIEVVYSLSVVGQAGDEITFTGSSEHPEVNSGHTTADFGTDVVSVVESPSVRPTR